MRYLFVCKNNLARSVMAEAFFKHFNPSIETRSASISRDYIGQSTPIIIWQAIYEKGIDVKNHRSTPLDKKLVQSSDKIIVLCEKEICPHYLTQSINVEYWNIKDPVDNVEAIFIARDVIYEKIKSLKIEGHLTKKVN